MHSSTTNKPNKQVNHATDLAPDGGWGWVVCFGAFMINFIADGTMFSFGILFLDLLDYFKDSKFKTAIVGSSQLGLSMMMGPVVSMLLKKYTCRQVTIAGGLIASVWMGVSIFSPNIELMILTYGVLSGAGICLVYLTSIIVVGLYFTKKRAIATGIATSGAGVGVFVYGYLTDYLLGVYDWKGTVIILSGLMLNCVVCGALFRPIRPHTFKEEEFEDMSCSGSSGYGGSSEEPDDLDHEESDSDTETVHVPIKLHKDTYHPPRGLKFKSAEDLSFLSVKQVDPRLHVSSAAVSKLNPDTKTDRIVNGLLHPMLRKDIFYSGSVSHLPDYDTCGGSLNSFLAKMTQDQSVCGCSESHLSQSKSRLKSIYDLSLFKDRIFWAVLMVCTLWTVQSIPITYVPGLAVTHGISRSNAALLISVVGISNTIGRVVAGFANDVLNAKSIVLYFVAFCIGAVVNFVFPFCETFPTLIVTTAGFGLCMAVAVSMRSIVIADLMKIERLTQSFGIIALFQGVAFIICPPLAGKLMDVTGTYMSPFFLVATVYFICATVCLLVILVHRQKNTKHQTVLDKEDWI
ncbi:hypothetical protein SNE40_020972 [Patella caerulea]|uniref:Major facilitator superfamily (MFS) profile domain-containing protein n=1 Tax=Patella caerulea TaxID=87958 RepID=A0AAN8GCY5_PATCE